MIAWHFFAIRYAVVIVFSFYHHWETLGKKEREVKMKQTMDIIDSVDDNSF